MKNLFRIRTEKGILLFSIILFVSVVGAYASSPLLIYVAFSSCILYAITSKNACTALIPFSIVVTWGAEIWGIGNSILYTLLKLLTVFIFFFKIFSKKDTNLKLFSFIVWLFLFFVYTLIGDFALSGGKGIIKAINLLICYLVVCLFSCKSNTRDLDLVSFSFGLGTALSACVSWMGAFIPKLQAVVIEMIQTTNTFGDFELGRFTAMTYDPNLYGFFVVVSIALSLCSMHRKGYRKILTNTVLTVLLYILGMMTLSKAFFIVGGLLLIFFMFQLLQSINISRRTKSHVTIGIIIAFVCVVYYLGVYFDVIAERFSGNDAGDLTTGRSNIWQFYLHYLFQNLDVLLVGASISGTFEGYSTPHNFIVYMLYFWGVIGSFIYYLMIKFLISSSKNSNILSAKRVKFIMALPLLTYVLFIMSIDPFMLYDIKIFTLSCCISSLILPVENHAIKYRNASI